MVQHSSVYLKLSLPTKVHPVFDASAKEINGVSLNDCLETGPNMMPDLPAILLRFRRWRIALSTDWCNQGIPPDPGQSSGSGCP